MLTLTLRLSQLKASPGLLGTALPTPKRGETKIMMRPDLLEGGPSPATVPT